MAQQGQWLRLHYVLRLGVHWQRLVVVAAVALRLCAHCMHCMYVCAVACVTAIVAAGVYAAAAVDVVVAVVAAASSAVAVSLRLQLLLLVVAVAAELQLLLLHVSVVDRCCVHVAAAVARRRLAAAVHSVAQRQ
jgi:hypothetical protein